METEQRTNKSTNNNMLYKQLGSVLILLMVSTTNGHSTLLRGSPKNMKTTSHPALTSMVGTWEAKDGVSTTIMGPFSVAGGKWLSITELDDDGNIYLRHDSMDQLMRVQNDKMQYCFNYEAPNGEGSDTAPFQLMPAGYNGHDKSTIVDFCWRGPRLPTHKADCTGCECAHWQLQLETDGKMKSTMWQSAPAIHFQVELTKTSSTVSTEEVVGGWQCEFQDSTGQPDNHDDLIHHGSSNCPYLKLKSKRERTKSTSSSSSLPAKFSLLMSARDTDNKAQLDYTVPQIPCMPCNVSFVFSVMTDEEDDYIALGFRGGVYSYTDWNDKMASENRTSGGLPDYFGMLTSSGWESIYGPQPLNGRIAAATQRYRC